MSTPKIGIALGGGAARGWAHIGILEVLNEADIKPDIVCGTSIGSLVGGVYANDKLKALKDWATGADWRVIMSVIDVGFLAGGLVDGARIVDWLSKMGGSQTIEDLNPAFGAVATDLTTGREIWLQDGEMGSAIRASIAIPGIFSPVDIDDRWLVDGGLVNPVPVSLCRAMGADFVIAVSLNEDVLGRPLTARIEKPKDTEAEDKSLIDHIKNLPQALSDQANGLTLFGKSPSAPGYFDVLTNSINIMQEQITRARLAGEPPHVLIQPSLADIGLMEFHRAEEAIEKGRKAAESALPTIRAKLRLE